MKIWLRNQPFGKNSVLASLNIGERFQKRGSVQCYISQSQICNCLNLSLISYITLVLVYVHTQTHLKMNKGYLSMQIAKGNLETCKNPTLQLQFIPSACTLQVQSLQCIVECWLHLDLPNCETTCAAPQWRLRRLQHMESETLMHLSVCCSAVLQCRVHLEMMVAHQRQLVTIVGLHTPPKAQTEYVIQKLNTRWTL